MRTKLLFAAVALSGAAAIGLSKDAGPHGQVARAPYEHHEHGFEAAEKAAHAYYGTIAQPHIIDSFEINGVKVFNGVVVRDGAEAKFTLTAAGEYMTMGLPQPLNVIAQGAQETAQFFKTPATAISQEDIHSYYVEVKGPRGLPYNIEFDAAGRIRDIKSPEEIFEDALVEPAGPHHHRISELTQSRFGNPVIDHVYKAKHDPGYYHVSFHNEHGKRGWAIINEQNDVTEFRAPIRREQVPDAVYHSMERELRGDKFEFIQQGASRLYQVSQLVGGESIVMLVKPNGAVDWINSRELHRHFLVGPRH